MIEEKVKQLYNVLSGFESKQKKEQAYPIHKRLVFSNSEYKDIYDWIIANCGVSECYKILDAGCGVGFGTQKLAQVFKAQALGISLSEVEVELATSYAKSQSVKFENHSYDMKMKEQFDLIVAVESIKHSKNASASISNLYEHLSPAGKLIVVEDLYLGQQNNKDANMLVHDWSLAKLYTRDDYLPDAKDAKLEYHDLNVFMPNKSKIGLYLKSKATAFGSAFGNEKSKEINKIFRGGFALDRLYQDGLMSYEAIIISKPV